MKKYKTKIELISHLENDRHLFLEEDSKSIFDVYRYGQIIDAYKDIVASSILSGNIHIYNDNVSLKTFINLLNMDEYFSIKLTIFISHYEKILKKYISDKVCASMVMAGSIDCCDYSLFEKMKEDDFVSSLDCFIPLNAEYNYDAKETLRKETTYNNRVRVIDKILGFVSGSNICELNYYVSDYYNEKQKIPFYILIGSLSFSNLIILFEMFDKEIQFEFLRTIVKKTHIENKDLNSLMGKHNVIRIIRNIIHHHEPLIPFLCKKGFIDLDTKIASIKMLLNIYETESNIAKLKIDSAVDFEINNLFTSKKAKKLSRFINILK